MQPPSGGPGELRGPVAAAATDATMRRGCRRSRRSDGAKQRRRKARSDNKAVARRRHRGASSTSTTPVVRPAGLRGGVRRRWATTTAMRGQELFGQRRVTRLASFNSRTLKQRWRQLELIHVLEQKNIVACTLQEHCIRKEEDKGEDVSVQRMDFHNLTCRRYWLPWNRLYDCYVCSESAGQIVQYHLESLSTILHLR